jgi:hypothetical protein
VKPATDNLIVEGNAPLGTAWRVTSNPGGAEDMPDYADEMWGLMSEVRDIWVEGAGSGPLGVPTTTCSWQIRTAIRGMSPMT